MALNLSMSSPHEPEFAPRITVIGVGGAGSNAVNNMIRSNLVGVEFMVTNTDAQALAHSLCDRRIQLGTTITAGLGAGSRPDVGRAAAEEAIDVILEQLHGSNMVFITAGMGGGTGTGAAPVLARAARERNILTVGVVTKPFAFEGKHRMTLAEQGIQDLQQYVDTLIVIPNQNLFRLATERTTFADAFKMADEVLHSGVRGVTDLMVRPGLINLDFADIRTVMSEMGKAMMGTGEATGDRRALDAAEAAISNPLLEDTSMKGARGVLINVTGGLDMTLFEVDEAANRIRDEVDPEANIIFGSTFDESLQGIMRVSVVATGIEVRADAVEPRRPQISLVAGRDAKPQQVDAGVVAAAGVQPAYSGGGYQPAPVMPAPVVPAYGGGAMPSYSGAQAQVAQPATLQSGGAPAGYGRGVPTMAASSHPLPQTAAQPTMEAPRYDTMGNAALAHQPQAYAEPTRQPSVTAPRPGALKTEAPNRPQPTSAPLSPLSGQMAAPSPAQRAAADGPFIAPPAVEAQGYAAQPAQPRAAAPAPTPAPAPSMGAPLAAPTPTPSRPAARVEPSKAMSLFQRITGAGRRETVAAPAEPQARAAQPSAQQRPAASETPERPAASGNREDDYDIPAFLRRQAN